MGTALKKYIQKAGIIFQFDNWFQILVSRLFFRASPAIFYRYKGLHVLIDHARGDQDGARSCLVPGLYDPALDEFDRDHPLRILDLGANTGGLSLALAARGFAFEKIVSVEFNPVTHSRLCYNLTSNIGPSCINILGAVSSSDRFEDVAFGSRGVSETLETPPDKVEFQSRTAVYTLDTLIEQHFPSGQIDLCKIDVEGSEYSMFTSPHHSSLDRCRNVIIEVHEPPAANLVSPLDVLTALGFERREPRRPFPESNVFWFTRVE